MTDEIGAQIPLEKPKSEYDLWGNHISGWSSGFKEALGRLELHTKENLRVDSRDRSAIKYILSSIEYIKTDLETIYELAGTNKNVTRIASRALDRLNK